MWKNNTDVVPTRRLRLRNSSVTEQFKGNFGEYFSFNQYLYLHLQVLPNSLETLKQDQSLDKKVYLAQGLLSLAVHRCLSPDNKEVTNVAQVIICNLHSNRVVKSTEDTFNLDKARCAVVLTFTYQRTSYHT